MRYILTHRLTMSTDGVELNLTPAFADIPGDPEEAWKRRIFRLREQRMHRTVADVQEIEAGHAAGVWWVEFSDTFACWSINDGKHVEVITATRLEYEEVPS